MKDLRFKALKLSLINSIPFLFNSASITSPPSIVSLLVLLVALPHSHSLLGFPSYPVNLVVAEYRKLERSRPGLSNPFVAASNKSKLLRMAIKAFPQLVPPPLTVRCPMSALGADRATLMRQTLMKGSEHGI